LRPRRFFFFFFLFACAWDAPLSPKNSRGTTLRDGRLRLVSHVNVFFSHPTEPSLRPVGGQPAPRLQPTPLSPFSPRFCFFFLDTCRSCPPSRVDRYALFDPFFFAWGVGLPIFTHFWGIGLVDTFPCLFFSSIRVFHLLLFPSMATF